MSAVYGMPPQMLREFGTEIYPYTYDHASTTFVIGAKEIRLSDGRLINELQSPSGEPVSLEEMPRHPVHIGLFGHPLTTPMLYSWLQTSCSEKALTATKRVIQEVSEDIMSSQMSEGVQFEGGKGPYGISAGFLRPGHLRLQTIGSCACLGVSIDGYMVDYEEWDTGYAEYEFHNIDRDEQRISLLAGLGHIASLSRA